MSNKTNELRNDACLLRQMEEAVVASGLLNSLSSLSRELEKEAQEQRIMSVFSIECDIVVKMLTKLFSRDAVLENELLTLQMLPGDLATLGKKIEDDFAPSPTGADPHKSTVDAYQAVMNSIHTLPEEVQGVLFRSHLATLRRLNAHKWEYGVNWVYRAVLGHAA